MRIQNSLKNMFFGVSGQIISAIMGFIVRTALIYTLGIEYVGIDGLFTSILVMLSLANLGFDTAIIYSLYKPLAENDQYRIQAFMNLYQKAYRIIGIIVLLIGLSLLPFLPLIIDGETSVKNIKIIYILFLVNSASSYYFVYKQSILIADQRQHVISKIHSIFIIISNISQILLLLSTRNYLSILSIQFIFKILENIFIAYTVNKYYPYLKGRNQAKLTKSEKKQFFENLYSLLLYKISGVVINGTDNILISAFVSVTAVGIYSNYLLILATLSTFLGYFFYSITASVGNLIVTENSEKQFFIFRVLHFANFWIYGLCAVCLWNLINPLITLWIGEQYVFNKLIVFAIILNFFTAGMQNASTTYRETTGLFKKGKYRPVIAAIINIVASIILAREIGISGIFIGTVLSRMLTYFWYDPYVIYKYVFKKSVKIYFLRYIWFCFLVFLCTFISDFIGDLFTTSLILNTALRLIICLGITNIVFFMFFKGAEEFIYLKNIASSFTNKLTSRVKNEKALSN